jgi:hypothetical protein
VRLLLRVSEQLASHTSDSFILKRLNIPDSCKTHEKRGCRLFAWMVKHYKLDIPDEQVRLVQHLILGDHLDGYPKWLFMIVACKETSLDTDKMVGTSICAGHSRWFACDH